ncbi:MAG: ATP-binding protein [Bacteroidota bacterium]
MDWLLLNPESIRTFSLVLLNLGITAYLGRARERPTAARWLMGFTASMAVFYLMRFIQATIFPTSLLGAFEQVPLLVESVVVPLGVGAYAQFCLRFLEHPFQREARVLHGVVGVMAAGLLVLGVLVIQGPVSASAVLYPAYSTCFLILLLWAAAACFRKRRRLSTLELPATVRASRRQAYLALGLLSLWMAAVLASIILVMGFGLPEVLWDLFVLPGVFGFFGGLVLVYLDHTPAPITIQAKLVAVSLTTTLVVIGMAGVLMFAPGELLPASGALREDNAGYVFTPHLDGGYTVTPATGLDVALASAPLALDAQTSSHRLALPFAFPFAEQTWTHVTVGHQGVLVFGDDAPPADGYQPYRDFFDPQPKIAPLFGFTGPDNRSGTGTLVHAARVEASPEAVRVTWTYPTLDPGPPPRAQVTLRPDGTVTFAYADLAAVADAEAPFNTLRGLHPGGHPDRVAFSPDPAGWTVPAGVLLVDDIGRTLRLHLHGQSARLFALMLIATALILLGFPYLFRTSLLAPLRRLTEGIDRVNRGEREVALPVRVQDEIGHLTAQFNQMTASLRTAEAELRAYADNLETHVTRRTADLEASRAQLEAQAEQLREMDALRTRLFANLSHEFRTPLTLLAGPLHERTVGTMTPEAFAAEVPIMHRNAQRLLRLIEQLLDLSRLEAGRFTLAPVPIDLGTALRDLALPFAPAAERGGLTLTVEAPASLPAMLDPDALEKVVSNLLSNAVKFTEPGGKVLLTLRTRPMEAGAPGAAITVSDTGCGVPAADLPHIFDRFYRVDAPRTHGQGGTGIGLSLAHDLAEQLGGTLEAASTEGFGSVFTLHLPLGVTETTPAAPQPESPAVLTSGDGAVRPAETTLPAQPVAAPDRPRILVIEDNAELRAYIRRHLAPQYATTEAADGHAGLAALHADPPDLVVCDVTMPGLDGFEVCRAIKTNPALNHLPVILLTARASEASRLEGLTHGADDYLTKPFSNDELRARIANLLATRDQLRTRFSAEVMIGPDQHVVPSADAAWLASVSDVVEQHLGDPAFSVGTLADHIGLSSRQLQRRLKQAVDLSPNQFIRHRRLERARQLLDQQAGTVTEIAYQVGFNDPDYFSRCFREAFGTLPSDVLHGTS